MLITTPPKISDAQARALAILATRALPPGFFNSGWGPLLYGERSHRVEVTEQTAASLARLKLARIRIVGNKPKDRLLEITQEGLEAHQRAKAG